MIFFILYLRFKKMLKNRICFVFVFFNTNKIKLKEFPTFYLPFGFKKSNWKTETTLRSGGEIPFVFKIMSKIFIGLFGVLRQSTQFAYHVFNYYYY